MAKRVRLLTDVERDALLFLRRRGDEGASVADIIKEGVSRSPDTLEMIRFIGSPMR
jgi:hypothetical protein